MNFITSCEQMDPILSLSFSWSTNKPQKPTACSTVKICVLGQIENSPDTDQTAVYYMFLETKGTALIQL